MPEYQPILDAVAAILGGLEVVDPSDSTATLRAGHAFAGSPDVDTQFEEFDWDIDRVAGGGTEQHVGYYDETIQLAMTMYIGPASQEMETRTREAHAFLGAAIDALNAGGNYGLGGLVDTQRVVDYAPGVGTLENNGVSWVCLTLGLTLTRSVEYAA